MSNAEGPLILRGTARFLHEAVGGFSASGSLQPLLLHL